MADSGLNVDLSVGRAAFYSRFAALLWKAGDDGQLNARFGPWKDLADEVMLSLISGDVGPLMQVPRTIYQRSSGVQTTVDATPVTFASTTIPAGSLGLGGSVRGKFAGGLTVGTGGGDTVTFELLLGGVSAAEIVVTDTDLSTVSYRFEIEFEFANFGTTSVQTGSFKITMATADGVPGASVIAMVGLVGSAATASNVTVELTAVASDVSDMSASCNYGSIALANVGS